MSLYDSLLHSLWLHGSWYKLTRDLTTEEKERFANAVERYSRRLCPDEEPLRVDRWWR